MVLNTIVISTSADNDCVIFFLIIRKLEFDSYLYYLDNSKMMEEDSFENEKSFTDTIRLAGANINPLKNIQLPSEKLSIDELKNQYQVNLDDIKNIADLEDKNLMEHIEISRIQSALYESQSSKLTSLENLYRSDADIRITMSTIMMNIKKQKMVLKGTNGDINICLRYLENTSKDLSKTVKSDSVQKIMISKLNSAEQELLTVVEAFTLIERDLTLMRQLYVKTIDDLKRHLTS